MGDEKEDKLGLSEAELTEVQKKILNNLLRNYQDVLRDEPGLAKGVHHVIETGDSPPKQMMPYRICPAWRDAIKKEISTLLEARIIEPTTSPWSSSIVPVKKPDGSVRLCIDFSKLNAVTTSDTYCMPLIEELLDQVGDCGFLSKLDLSIKYQSEWKTETKLHFVHLMEYTGLHVCRLGFVMPRQLSAYYAHSFGRSGRSQCYLY